MQVHFVLDYRSPFAYLANTQIALIGAQINYEPIDILSVMKTVNNQPVPMCPSKAKYARLDATRWAKHYGVHFSPNGSLFEALRQGRIRNDLFSRAGIAGQQLGILEKTNNALFGAVWAGSDDLVSAEGRSQFAARHALPPELWDVAESAAVEDKLAANNERAVARGVFGVPTFFVNNEMFFGNDRLSFVTASLEAARAKANQ